MARITPGSPVWKKIMDMYRENKTLHEIGAHPDIQRDHTTILHHIQKAGLAPRGRGIKGGVKRPPQPRRAPLTTESFYRGIRIPQVYRERKPEVFGPGRCALCGIIQKYAPGHDCSKGSYFDTKPEDRFGNSFPD